jgi:L,D-transpeptidase catalytic domain
MSWLSGLKRPRTRVASLVTSVLALGMVVLSSFGNQVSARGQRAIETIESRTPGEPVMAIVSLRSQHITVYDADGWILRAPVSSGQTGRETPAGIFAVIQKDADHHSNLYDDANMPNMQRITWSGIALHGGPLPGYPASHGCVRLPFEFAEQLFPTTRMGMRVIVAPTDVAPAEIAHPVLAAFKSGVSPVAADLTTSAGEAARKADEARFAAGKAFREAAQAQTPVRTAENLKARAQTELAIASAEIGSAALPEQKEQAEKARADAAAKVAALDQQLAAARAELQPKIDAAASTREAAALASAAEAAAADASRQIAKQFEPVSVLISRKTQRIYVRQAFEPVLDSPVTIADPDRPIGTHVFTALERSGADNMMRWNVVSMLSGRGHDRVAGPRGRVRGNTDAEIAQASLALPDDAKAALDRVAIPQDVLDRIALAPRSSLIITDEPLSNETGKGTDFVVLMSGEPQGGIKMRHRPADSEVSVFNYSDRVPSYRRSAINRPFFDW